jgi:hypothetical protein
MYADSRQSSLKSKTVSAVYIEAHQRHHYLSANSLKTKPTCTKNHEKALREPKMEVVREALQNRGGRPQQQLRLEDIKRN